MRLTPCECPAAGWCERHKCMKHDAMFQLCRRSETSFNEWEAGRGPCIPIAFDPPDESSAAPTLWRRILNFGKATVRHAASGFEQVSPEDAQTRLEICRNCPACDLENMICRNQACGCQLQVKANWASEACPMSKWPEIRTGISTRIDDVEQKAE